MEKLASPAPAGKVAVGDFAWEETNKNGVQDAGEPGLEGVTLILTGPDGATIAMTTTDANGRYVFENLPALKPGERYTIAVTTSEGYKPTVDGKGDRATAPPTPVQKPQTSTGTRGRWQLCAR